MTIKIGDTLPNATFRMVTADGPKPVTTQEYFAGRRIVLFGLPGAFTPTCHKNHLPGFIAEEAAIKAKGIDAIAMTSVNDHHVLAAWAKATGAEGHIDFLADGSAEFRQGGGPQLRRGAERPGRALAPLFGADRGRNRQAAQHRGDDGQGRPVGRSAHPGAALGAGPKRNRRVFPLHRASRGPPPPLRGGGWAQAGQGDAPLLPRVFAGKGTARSAVEGAPPEMLAWAAPPTPPPSASPA